VQGKRGTKRAGTRVGRATVQPAKKRPRPGSDPFSQAERDEARGLLRAASDLLHAYGEELDDLTIGPRKRVDLRTDLRTVADFVEQANGGRLFERNRRWALLFELTKDARERKQRPTAAYIAQWPLLPASYAASTKDATKARELLVKAVAAEHRYDWLEALRDAIITVEPDEMGTHDWEPEALEATILAHQRVELRVFGVSDDEA
jgi:hypothetical protein